VPVGPSRIPAPQAAVPPNGLAQNDEIINDLSADAKLAIRQAAAKARVRTSARPQTSRRFR
jgi:hypothetical protein